MIRHFNANKNHAVIGDINIETSQICFETCMETHNCFNLINNDTFFKGFGSFIELNLTGIKVYCQGNFLFKIGLSDHHHIYYITKSTFGKKEPKYSTYRNYKQFHWENEKSSLIS